MPRAWRIALLGASGLLVGMQMFPPATPGAQLPGDGTIADHLAVPADVDALLRRACYDCHSQETRWPWYSRIAPVSWYIAHDVRHGRSNLDFSSWSTDPDLEPTPVQRVSWMCRDIRRGLMPPELYRLAHPEARLTGDEEGAICTWSDETRRHLEAVSPTDPISSGAPAPVGAGTAPPAARSRPPRARGPRRRSPRRGAPSSWPRRWER